MLTRQFGKAGKLSMSLPVESITVQWKLYESASPSGVSTRWKKIITLRSSVIIELYHVAQELTERLSAKGFQGSTLTLKV